VATKLGDEVLRKIIVIEPESEEGEIELLLSPNQQDLIVEMAPGRPADVETRQ
jgi:hypothetical protein